MELPAPSASLIIRTHNMAKTHHEQHLIGRVGWLRAAVLGANDGILSTARLMLGVATAHATHALNWLPTSCRGRAVA